MRDVTDIVIHCSATPEGRDIGAAEIDAMHRERGFVRIGYHYVIRLDGRVETGRDEDAPGAHLKGHNSNSIGVCYVGGYDRDLKAKDTRTEAQTIALVDLIRGLLKRYPGARVTGHRDWPAVNKACPCFDVIPWWASVA